MGEVDEWKNFTAMGRKDDEVSDEALDRVPEEARQTLKSIEKSMEEHQSMPALVQFSLFKNCR